MKITLKLGRFYSSEHIDFFRAITQAYKISKKLSKSERIYKLIMNSLRRDVKEESRPQPHERDVISIGNHAADYISKRVPSELEEKEMEMIQSEVVAAQEFIRARLNRLQELSGKRSGYISRQMEIELASANVQTKVARVRD